MNYVYVKNNYAYSDKEYTKNINKESLINMFNDSDCVVIYNDKKYAAIGLTIADDYSALTYLIDDIEQIVYSFEYIEDSYEEIAPE